jgi:L-lactate dehydrogenase complex protein LldF
MSDQFHERILTSLENSALQEALDGNAERRLKARQQAYASLPEELQVMRQRAHTVRAQTIANLETLLKQFIHNAQANGFIIHQAVDATQAVRAVLDIAQDTNARLIVKSKTMVGEEIELNETLQRTGLTVIESDLGEYIVQLRGERPAHIITPAVHLRRGDVARTFTEKLGVPYNEDIPTMTAIARQVLRQTFLQADIGVSGVNFGIAESGTLCLLTNEGNGRMVTTLPRVHIALMGVERLLPSLADLALMLELLPRSATGQKLTVYTGLIHGPRRPQDPEGPEQRHLILVDNGRRSLLGSPLEEALYCIRCGACLNACPVFRELGGHAYVGAHGQATAYPGPIGSVVSPGLLGFSEFGNLARATSLCGACKEACPVDIDLPRMLLRIRAGMEPLRPKPQAEPGAGRPKPLRSQPSHLPTSMRLGLGMYTWAASNPRRFAAAQRLAGWFSRLLAPTSAWLRMPGFTGWGISRDFPRPATDTFRQRFTQKARLSSSQIGQSISQSNSEASLPDQPSTPSSTLAEPGRVLIDRFEQEFITLGGTFTICQPGELSANLLTLLAKKEITRLQAWDGGHLPNGLLESLQAEGIEIVHGPDPDLKAGVTGALAGIAETGTLVLTGGSGQPLTASLMPEFHIAILDSNRIIPSVEQLFKNQQPIRQEILAAPAAVLISGPSRTADIEMTLTIGVHGPREVHIYCLE